MIWVDREVKKIAERKLKIEWVDDMKTPSGRIHVGSLRGVIIHDLMYKVLTEKNIPAKYTYVFNDLDQMDSIPSYLNYDEWEKYAGMPLCNIPSPEPGAKSFAEYYANEFQQVFESINCHPEILRSSELYRSGKMNDVIKEVLDAAPKIREIFLTVSKATKPADWFPFQVICEKCGKLGTTYVNKWDGEFVYYQCKPDMAQWAKGCGHEGKVSPYNGTGKLHWKLDWPAHWKKIGVTIEGSGKDHMSAGGSYDFASAVCREVLHYDPPYALGYEFFNIAGKKMSSSKGLGATAVESSKILPPELLRFLLVRTPNGTAIDFNPYGDTIPNLFDDYDRCLSAYMDKLENKIPLGKEGEVILEFARIAELSEVRPHPKKRIYIPRFRTVVSFINSKADIYELFEKHKGSKLTEEESEVLKERIEYAHKYLKNYAAKDEKVIFNKAVPKNFQMTNEQRLFITELLAQLQKQPAAERDAVQEMVFNVLKKNNLKPKEVFSGFYRLLINKDFGPKASDLILEYGIDKTATLFSNALNPEEKQKVAETKDSGLFSIIDDKSIFSINKDLSAKFPSVAVGIAIINGVTIQAENEELNKQIAEFEKSQTHLTNEIISAFPEVLSYRKLYKEMKIDWHSRRPSPEALLRRLSRKKPLYKINTCVDAYNLIVMKNRVSVGAFDLDKMKFPTELRFPKEGEEILLLGDTEPTKYKTTELAYFDQEGGYNIDFNYRDAQRTAVTTETKNLYINVDGIYDITKEKIEQSLKETIDLILHYCGGKLKMAGIVQG